MRRTRQPFQINEHGRPLFLALRSVIQSLTAFGVDAANQIPDVLETLDFSVSETDLESAFDCYHQANVTEAVPLFDILGRRGNGDRKLIKLENVHHDIVYSSA